MSTYTLLSSLYTLFITLATILGNGLVLAAWIFHPDIQTPANLYLTSLAFVDLLTGLLQLPLVLGYGLWPFGPTACFTFIAGGWILSSVSIYHLLAIALDRYQGLTYGVSYLSKRTLGSVGVRVGLIWGFCLWLVAPSVADGAGIRAQLEASGTCTSTLDAFGRLHICSGVFFGPILVLGGVYYRVYRKIGKKIRRKLEGAGDFAGNKEQNSGQSSAATEEFVTEDGNKIMLSKNCKRVAEMAAVGRSRRAAKTLGVMVAAFTGCWGPFAVLYATIGFLPGEWAPSPGIFAAVLTLGFSNSAMNPVIYARYSPEFRDKFGKMLGKCWGWLWE